MEDSFLVDKSQDFCIFKREKSKIINIAICMRNGMVAYEET